MGQTLGRAPLPAGCSRFLNLPRSCVYDLWDAFNDIAEGFGLSIEEFQEITKSALMEHLGVTERILNSETDKVFRALDDDDNNLVDSLEFLSAFALLSGMTPDEKLRFIFAMYDFDETSILTLDEMVLAFRSTLSGLSKLCKIDPPTEAEVEGVVVQAFGQTVQSKAYINDDNKVQVTDSYEGIDKETFLNFCLNTPEVLSWIDYFDDLEEYDDNLRNRNPMPIKLSSHLSRSTFHFATMDATLGGLAHLELEKKGFAKNILPKKSWESVIPFITPSRLPQQVKEVPSHNFGLDWVYGYNTHSSRQNLHYTSTGAIVYAAGTICIVQDVMRNVQSHFDLHNDVVTCLKLFKSSDGSNTVVASGECGVLPSILIWEAESKLLLSCLKGFHKNGISQLDFSPDKEKLVSLGMDTYHSIAVYAWKSQKRLWASRTNTFSVFDVRFLSDNLIGSCGKDHIIFWRKLTGNGFKKYRGLFGGAMKTETMLCVAMVGSTVVSGSDTGMLHAWEGRNWISSVRGHSGSINAMHVIDQGNEKGLVTACTMGKIQLWSSKLEIGGTFNATILGSIDHSINSVSWDFLTSKILVGFKSSEIYEIDSIDGKNIHHGSLVAGHYRHKVSCVTTHPLNPSIFCTVGNDKTIRIFDAKRNYQLRMSMLDTVANSCVYSPDGQLILVGLGSGITGMEERKEGAYIMLNEEDLTIIHEARDSKCMLTDCKFSPGGDIYALSSLDGSIYLYATRNFAAKAKCRGHVGGVNHIDFSNDGKFLMSNSISGELLFWDVDRGEQQAPKLMKEIQWDTISCVFCYWTQGIWSIFDDKFECNAVTRSNGKEMISSVDNFGRTRIFCAPCIKEDSNFLILKSHGADAQCCKFSCDDTFLFTTGGTDGAICKWVVKAIMNQDFDDMKYDDAPNEQILTEVRNEGKALDWSDLERNVINNSLVAIAAMEEGAEPVNLNQPWHRTIVAPSKALLEDNFEPSSSIELEHVNGFCVDKSRQSLMYARNGEILFFSSAVSVLMNQQHRKQRFYQEHSTTIMSMAVHPIINIVATGQQSESAVIRIWDADTMRTISILEGFHRRGICHLMFSPNGTILASVGFDHHHTIALYDWKNQQIISYSKGFSCKSFCLSFHPKGASMIQCGNEVIRFWDINGLQLNFQEALFSGRAKLQRFLCIGWIGANAVVGTADGNLYRFVGRQLDGMVQAHIGSINSIASSNDGICTCGVDGLVKVWTRILDCRLLIDMKSLNALNTNIRCVEWDADNGRILIGTMGCEIFEVSSNDGENLHVGSLMDGHSGDSLCGIAVHPIKDLYATVGDDSILHVWDIFEHRAISTIPLEMSARCCCYSPDGRSLAIGFGCPKRINAKQYDGKWIVLDTEDYQITHEARDSTKWLTDMKYSPSGDLLAIGSTDCKLYIYSVTNGYALNAVIGQHNATVLSFDFSDDSSWLQSNCAGMELNFFEADTGMFIPAPSRLRDVTWATHTCPMTWALQGVWPGYSDGTQITSADCNLFRGIDGTVIATGDNFGRIQLFRYPSVNNFCCSKKYKASSTAISKIKFASGDAFLISISGIDKTIFQWSHNRDRIEDIAWNMHDRSSAIDEDDEDILGFFCLKEKDETLPEFISLTNTVGAKPWISSIIAPTIIPDFESTMPKIRLEKSHIFGFESQTTRLSVRYNMSGDILFPASQYVCIFNRKSNTQTYYEGHCQQLSCICVSRDGKFASSAERVERPSIHIWDACTSENIIVLPFLHRRGVASMEFSRGNELLVSIGQDQDHSIAIWQSPNGEWCDGHLLAWNKGDVNPVTYCTFYHNHEYILASGGRFHQKFWSLKGANLNPNFAEYSNKQKLGTMLSGAAIDNHVFVSGSAGGNIFVWHDRKLDRVIRAHELGVTSIWACNIGILSTSKDGMIKLWNSSMEHIRSFSLLDADVPPLQVCIRSVDCSLSDDHEAIIRVLVATMGGEIYELSTKSGSICLLHESHCVGELWGLGVHPTDPDVIVTAGDDKTVRIWSISQKRILRKAVLDCTARCVNFSPDGRTIIVGLGGTWDGKRQRKDGAFLILDSKNLKPLFEGRDSRHWLQEAKFSPNGKLFAVGSMDHKIYLYNSDSYRLRGTCDRHNSYIKNFDFSEDSVYIQSDSGDHEHLYFESEDGQYFAAGAQLKDIRWADWSCTFGWPVQGAWPYYDDVNHGVACDPISMNRSQNQLYLAVGDCKGFIKFYHYPCVEKKSIPFVQGCHIGEVAKVKFTCDDRCLISVGKNDRSIIIWKVLPESF